MATEYVEGGGQDQGDFGGGNHGRRVALFCQYGSRVGFLPMVYVDLSDVSDVLGGHPGPFPLVLVYGVRDAVSGVKVPVARGGADALHSLRRGQPEP